MISRFYCFGFENYKHLQSMRLNFKRLTFKIKQFYSLLVFPTSKIFILCFYNDDFVCLKN